MKKNIRLIAFALFFALVLSTQSLALAVENFTTVSEFNKIVILHTNDVHCKIEQASANGAVTNIGYAGVAAYKLEMQELYGAENVTLVDAGDAISGGIIGSLTSGRSVVGIMNEAGYDLAVPGNHEFDYTGATGLLTLANEEAKYPYISSNFIDLSTGKSVFDAYKIIAYGGVKVAYVGICTPEVIKISALSFQDGKGNYLYGFCQGGEGQELYDNVQKSVNAARADGADYVVALGHLGTNGIDSRWQAEAVLKNTSGIDILLDGHSHEQYEKELINKDGKNVVLAQTGTALAAIGKIVIDTKTGAITHELVRGYAQQYPDTLACVAKVNAEFSTLLNQPIGRVDFPLTINDLAVDKRAIRSGETNLGDFTTDAYRAALGTDIAITNSGMIRAGVAAGPITSGDLLNYQPFDGDLCVVEATGQQIYEALEMGSRNCPEESGGFLQVSGLTYTIDCSIPSPVVTDDSGAFVKAEGVRRVKNVMVGTVPLNPTKTYTVAANVYLVKYGTDGYTNLKNCKVLNEGLTTLKQSVIDYVEGPLGGVIPERYRDPYGQGRITILNAPSPLPEWYDAARYVISSRIMTGTDSLGTFSPDTLVTRATIYQALYNFEGRPVPESNVDLFPDISDKWYSAAANWSVEAGLTAKETAAFRGDDLITGTDAVQVLSAYGAYKGIVYSFESIRLAEFGTLSRSALASAIYDVLYSVDTNSSKAA